MPRETFGAQGASIIFFLILLIMCHLTWLTTFPCNIPKSPCPAGLCIFENSEPVTRRIIEGVLRFRRYVLFFFFVLNVGRRKNQPSPVLVRQTVRHPQLGRLERHTSPSASKDSFLSPTFYMQAPTFVFPSHPSPYCCNPSGMGEHLEYVATVNQLSTRQRKGANPLSPDKGTKRSTKSGQGQIRAGSPVK